MTTAPTRLAVAAVALLAATSPGWGQDAPAVTGGAPVPRAAAAASKTGGAPPARVAAPSTPSAPSKTGSFENMMAGDRKIARALFLAQHPTVNGPAPLSLNQIADLKSHDSWARVFKQMQTQGLIRADNLGQVVSAYEHQLRSDAFSGGGARRTASAAGTPRRTTLVTNGHGEVIASSRSPGAGIAHGGSQVEEDNSSAVATASGTNRGH